MIATTVMAVIMISWCLVTLAVKGPANNVPIRPDLDPKWELKEVDAKDPRTPARRSPLGSRTPNRSRAGRRQPLLDAEGNPVLDAEGKPVYVPKESEALHKLGIDAQEDPLGFGTHLLPDERRLPRQLRRPSASCGSAWSASSACSSPSATPSWR